MWYSWSAGIIFWTSSIAGGTLEMKSSRHRQSLQSAETQTSMSDSWKKARSKSRRRIQSRRANSSEILTLTPAAKKSSLRSTIKSLWTPCRPPLKAHVRSRRSALALKKTRCALRKKGSKRGKRYCTMLCAVLHLSSQSKWTHLISRKTRAAALTIGSTIKSRKKDASDASKTQAANLKVKEIELEKVRRKITEIQVSYIRV